MPHYHDRQAPAPKSAPKSNDLSPQQQQQPEPLHDHPAPTTTYSSIMQLQRAIGNKATMSYLRSLPRTKPVIQRVVVNGEGEPYPDLISIPLYAEYKRNGDEAGMQAVEDAHNDQENTYTADELLSMGNTEEDAAVYDDDYYVGSDYDGYENDDDEDDEIEDEEEGQLDELEDASSSSSSAVASSAPDADDEPPARHKIKKRRKTKEQVTPRTQPSRTAKKVSAAEEVKSSGRSGKPKPRADVLVPPQTALPRIIAKYKRKNISKHTGNALRERDSGDGDRSVNSAMFGGLEHSGVKMSEVGLSQNHIIADSNIARTLGTAVTSADTDERKQSVHRFLSTLAGSDAERAASTAADFDEAQAYLNDGRSTHARASITRTIDDASVGGGNLRPDDAPLNTAILHGADYPLSGGRQTEMGENVFHGVHDLSRHGVIPHERAFEMTAPSVHATRDSSGVLHGRYLSSSSTGNGRWGDMHDPDTFRARRTSAPDQRRARSEPREMPSDLERKTVLPETPVPFKPGGKKRKRK